MTVFDIAAEGGWRDLKMVQRYTKNPPFEELQRLPTPLSFVHRKRALRSQGSGQSGELPRNQVSIAIAQTSTSINDDGVSAGEGGFEPPIT